MNEVLWKETKFPASRHLPVQSQQLPEKITTGTPEQQCEKTFQS